MTKPPITNASSSAALDMLRVRLSNMPSLSETVTLNTLNPVKKLGQNFLLDMNITDKIVRLALSGYKSLHDLNVIEIGPGPGGLTRSLLAEDVKSVTAVEFDPRAVQALSALKKVAGGKLSLVPADALRTDIKTLCNAPRAIVANLPYNIATPLLIGWLKDIQQDVTAFSAMTLMFQKEVADRICATPHTKSYGRLSIMAQWVCRVSSVYTLPPSAFTPPPKVNSSIVHCIPRVMRDDSPSFKSMERVVAMGFGARRKMIRQSLKEYKVYFESCGIDETLRAENLTIENFVALAKAYEKNLEKS